MLTENPTEFSVGFFVAHGVINASAQGLVRTVRRSVPAIWKFKFRFIEQFIKRDSRGRSLAVPFYRDFATSFRGVEGAAPYKRDFKRNDKFEFT